MMPRGFFKTARNDRFSAVFVLLENGAKFYFKNATLSRSNGLLRLCGAKSRNDGLIVNLTRLKKPLTMTTFGREFSLKISQNTTKKRQNQSVFVNLKLKFTENA